MQGNFSDINQKDWKRACKKLGLEVDCSRGKGSHFLIRHPRTNAKYTIQKDLHKFINTLNYETHRALLMPSFEFAKSSALGAQLIAFFINFAVS